MRSFARIARGLRDRARFHRWIARLRFELWRHGMSLDLRAQAAPVWDEAPAIKAYPGQAEGSALRLVIGRDVQLGRGLTLEVHAAGQNRVEFGDGVRCANNVRLMVRGGEVSVGDDGEVRDGAWIKSDGVFRTGRSVTIGPYSAIHCTQSVVLADLVGLGERVSVTDSDHVFDGTDEHYMKKDLLVSPVSLGRQTMIAFGAVVLRGTEIGPNAVVGANSVVRGGNYGAASLLAGNPARAVKDLRTGADSAGPAGLAA